MNTFLPKTGFLFFILSLIAILWLPIEADEPTAVHLSDFDVVPLNNAVRIEWETGSELGTAGFRIKRAATGGSEEFLTNIGDNGFVIGVGGVSVGGFYSETDNQVFNGEIYTYILIEIENSGNEIELARKTITVGIPPTNTPIVVSSGPGGGTNTQATNTPTPRKTSEAPQTNQSITSTPPATNTPSKFVTVTPRTLQPASPIAQPSDSIGGNQTVGNNNGNSTNTTALKNDENTDASVTGVTVVLAQEEDSPVTQTLEIAAQTAPENQEDYPGTTPSATAVTDTSDAYPVESSAGEATYTPLPVIGSAQGYSGEQPFGTDVTESGSSSSSTQGRIFLWIGFIVALLIFATGLIGSILLFIRKAN